MGAQNNIDTIILRAVGEKGFFIEAGGSDPHDQSNTALLESKGWTGLVVEPNPEFNQKYREYRPNTIVENYALVDFNWDKDFILADCSRYMTGGVLNIHGSSDWNPQEYPATTLDRLLKKHNITEVHFFSLDVEGYETQVLNGINFSETLFHILVVENHASLEGINPNSVFESDFAFLETFGFEKKLTIGQHEFYVNQKSKYYNNFVSL